MTAGPSAPGRGVLERMTESIRHRGPDESGFYHDDRASLGHRRVETAQIYAEKNDLLSRQIAREMG